MPYFFIKLCHCPKTFLFKLKVKVKYVNISGDLIGFKKQRQIISGNLIGCFSYNRPIQKVVLNNIKQHALVMQRIQQSLNCNPKKTSVPPNAKVRGYMYPHLQKTVGMLTEC